MIPIPVRRKARGIEKSKTSTALQPRGTSCHADRFTRSKTFEVDSNFRERGCGDEAYRRVVEGRLVNCCGRIESALWRLWHLGSGRMAKVRKNGGFRLPLHRNSLRNSSRVWRVFQQNFRR
jgi:hypothetical protein